MKENDRRKYPRIETSNLIQCCYLDENENELGHCMGRAINVSPVGVKIELFNEMDSEKILLITVDSDDKLIQIDGQVVHSNRFENGRFEVGMMTI